MIQHGSWRDDACVAPTRRGVAQKCDQRVVELLDLAVLASSFGEVDRATVDARRRAGLESRDLEPERLELLGEMRRGRLAGAAARERVVVPMWMRPRRKVPVVMTTRRAPKRRPSSVSMPTTRSSVDEEARDGALNRVETGVLLEQGAHRATVQARDRTARAAPRPPDPCCD